MNSFLKPKNKVTVSTVLIFEQGMNEMLKQAAKNDYEGETLLLAKVSKILRKELANFKGFQFDGCFTSRCQQESVPSVLKTFVSMLLNGIDLKDNDCTDSQRVLTVSQTILFNYNTKPTSSAIKFRHSTNREPPLPLFIGLKVHTETRSKKMIMHLYDLGPITGCCNLRISLQMQSVKISVIKEL